jgi:hypothetical protein
MDSDIAMPGSLSQAPRAEHGDDEMGGISTSSLARAIRLQQVQKKKDAAVCNRCIRPGELIHEAGHRVRPSPKEFS